MFRYTDTDDSPWWVVEADDKRRAHLNCITHLLDQVPFEDLPDSKLVLPPRESDEGHVRPPRSAQRYVPEVWWSAKAVPRKFGLCVRVAQVLASSGRRCASYSIHACLEHL
jgi:Polyphosphate kinase 2 (PPK2)